MDEATRRAIDAHAQSLFPVSSPPMEDIGDIDHDLSFDFGMESEQRLDEPPSGDFQLDPPSFHFDSWEPGAPTTTSTTSTPAPISSPPLSSILLQNLRDASVILQDGPTARLNVDFLRRRGDGKFVNQGGRFQLDWPKVLRSLSASGIDTEAHGAKRKHQYQDVLKTVDFNEKTDRVTDDRIASLETKMDGYFNRMDAKLDALLLALGKK